MSFVKSILQQWRDRNLKKNTYSDSEQLIVSDIPGFPEQKGEITIENVWPGKKRATDYPVGKNWFTDRGDKNLIENDCLGSKTVSKWRNDAMEDWGKRWSWLKK